MFSLQSCKVASTSCLRELHFDTFPHAPWLSILSCTKLRDIDDDGDDVDDDDDDYDDDDDDDDAHGNEWFRC